MAGPLDRWTRPGWGWRGGEVPPAANPRREQALQRLGRLAAARPDPTEWQTRPRLSSVLRSPATPDEVVETELRLGMALPEDYASFLLLSNGATLVDAQESGRQTLELLGTVELVQYAEEAAWHQAAGPLPELLIFAAGGSEDGRLVFETGRMNPSGGCAVLDAQPGYRSDQWWVICRDFTDWLNRVLTDPGPPGSFGRHWEPTDPQPVLPLPGLAGS